jgi:polyhydroxyalkanoate synthesis repressor PhaR
MLVIKKYPNRRLYDTVESRYITLEDLAERIKAGSDVLVQDATSGADLTQATLTQIVLESRNGARLLPVPLLLRLIRLGDEALAEFLGRYVSWALEMYVQARQGARALMPLNPLANAPFAATDALARLVLGATQWRSGTAGPVPSSSTAAAPPVPFGESEPPPEAPGDEHPRAVRVPHMPTGEEVAAAIEAETAHVHGEVADVADDLARLRRELEALKLSMTAVSRDVRATREAPRAAHAAPAPQGASAGRTARPVRSPRKAPAKKR